MLIKNAKIVQTDPYNTNPYHSYIKLRSTEYNKGQSYPRLARVTFSIAISHTRVCASYRASRTPRAATPAHGARIDCSPLCVYIYVWARAHA